MLDCRLFHAHGLRVCLLLVAMVMGGLGGRPVEAAAPRSARLLPEPGRVYAIAEAVELGFVTARARSLGTFREVEYTVTNITAESIEVRFDAGMYFRNPDPTRQNLITLVSVGEKIIRSRQSCTVNVPSACTNAPLGVPDLRTGWNPDDAPLGLDHAVRFYGKHQKAIDGWLAKKNPELFGTEKGRQVFLQLVIWAYLDAQYDDILRMLAGTVFHEDLARAEAFIAECYESAKEVATLIKERDTRAMADWTRRAIAENVDTDALRERGRGLWRGVRDRFNR